MSSFQKGNVAILKNCRKYPHLNGEAVIIASTLTLCDGGNNSWVWGHKLASEYDGMVRFAMLNQLDKAPPPSQGDRLTKVTWADCAWQPYHKPDCMALAIELKCVRDRIAALRRRIS